MSERKRRKNPFRAGAATDPGRLVGRDEIQRYIKDVIDALILKEVPLYTPTVLYGPRGMGKTVLLKWAAEAATEMARDERAELEVLYSTGRQVLPDIAGIRKLTPFGKTPGIGKRAWAKIASLASRNPIKLTGHISADGDIGGMRGGIEAKGEIEHGGEKERMEDTLIFHPSIIREKDALFARCRRKPVLLLIDEAHTYPQEFKRDIIAIAVSAIAEKIPLHLMLAGTPGIIKSIRSITYGERAEEKPIGRMDEKATKDAIRLPLEGDGMTISEGALDIILEESQRYPYFIQKWGYDLWDEAEKRGIAHITKEEIESVRGKVEGHRNQFYLKRYNDIEDPKYLAAHYAVAGAVNRRRLLSHDIFVDVIEEALPVAGGGDRKMAGDFARNLEAADFLWSLHGEYQAGIPSFMSYVERRFRGSRPEMAAAIDAIQDRWHPEPPPEPARGHLE